MVSKAICRDGGAIYCQGFGSSPMGPICSYNNTFYLCASRKGGGRSTVERRKQALAVNQMMYIREIISTDYTLGRHHTPCPPFAKPGFPCRDYWLSHNAAGSSA